MTREEAKEKLRQADSLCQQQQFNDAWGIIEELYKTFPSSLSVVHLRAKCFMGLGKFDEALVCCDQLEGKLDAAQLKALRDSAKTDALQVAPTPSNAVDTGSLGSSSFGTKPVPATSEPAAAADSNVFIVESVFPSSSEETTVTGHVAAGTFYAQDSVSLISSTGLPLLVPIQRIGSTETPLKMIRKGQSATLLLQVEPQYVVPGSKLVSSDSADSYAETMVVTDGSVPSVEASPEASMPPDERLLAAERLLNERGIMEVREKLTVFLAENPSSSDAHRLMARSYLEAEHEERDIEKAREHITKAYELGGADNPRVLETLAATYGAKGESEHGLRFLERVYAIAESDEERGSAAKRVISYRTRYRLGHAWEFSNGFGEVFFESEDVDAIHKAIVNKSIPENSRCRKDKVGDWGSLEEVLAPEYPQIAEIFSKPTGSLLSTVLIWGTIGFVLGAGGIAAVKGLSSILLVVGGLVGAAVLGAIGAIIAKPKDAKK